MAKRFGPRDARQAERFDIPRAEYQVAGRIPFLTREDLDVDRVEAIEVDPPLVTRPEAGLHDDPAIGQPIAPLITGGSSERRTDPKANGISSSASSLPSVKKP